MEFQRYWDYFTNIGRALVGGGGSSQLKGPNDVNPYIPGDWRTVVSVFRAYVQGPGAYRALEKILDADGKRRVKGVRLLHNPPARVVQFYGGVLWPKELEDLITLGRDDQLEEGPEPTGASATEAAQDPAGVAGATTPAAQGAALAAGTAGGAPPTQDTGQTAEDAAEQLLKTAILQIYEWSNFGETRRGKAEELATVGTTFTKVAESSDGERFYFDELEPEWVTDFDIDQRGFLTYIRLDIPKQRRNVEEGTFTDYWVTEIWDKSAQRMRLWQRDEAPEQDLKRMGPPMVDRIFAEPEDMTNPDGSPVVDEFGFPVRYIPHDFIPIVRTVFRGPRRKFGLNAFGHALEAVDESNNSRTALNNTAFRHGLKVKWKLRAGAMGPDNRPMAAPTLDVSAMDRGNASGAHIGAEGSGQVATDMPTQGIDEKEWVVRLPGMSDLDPMVPSLPFADINTLIGEILKEIEGQLPEMRYYRLTEMTDISGVAVRQMLGDVIELVEHSRMLALRSLVRLNQMALTMAKRSALGWREIGFEPPKSLQPFEALGEYRDGDLDHHFADEEILPTTELERETVQTAKAATIKAFKEISPTMLRYYLEDYTEMTDTEIDAVMGEIEQARAAAQTRDLSGIVPGNTEIGA